MVGAFIGVILSMTLIAVGVVRSRKYKSVPSEVVGTPKIDGLAVPNATCHIPEPPDNIISDERVPPESDSGRLQSDGLEIDA